MRDSKTISVSILGKEYQVSCPANELVSLKRAAGYLDKKMRETKENSNVIGMDRLAVMTALNLADETLQRKEQMDQANAEKDEAINEVQTQKMSMTNISLKIDDAIKSLDIKELLEK
ncbi:MAG: cell division protein ZapA [Gammaproteobacteria bacterium]|nr:cell division protein ZapA [Gammaproteobacteria bacterium]